MSFSESDFVASKASVKEFVRAEPYKWADIKYATIPFKTSQYHGRTLESVVLEGGRDGLKALRRISRWGDNFIDPDLRDKIRVAIKYRAAFEKWLIKQEEQKSKVVLAAVAVPAEESYHLAPAVRSASPQKKRKRGPYRKRVPKKAKGGVLDAYGIAGTQ